MLEIVGTGGDHAGSINISTTASFIVGGKTSPTENAAVTRAILTGAQGAKTDIVLLNAGAAIYIGGKADSIKEGVEKARTLIESGAAEKKLQEFIEQSNA